MAEQLSEKDIQKHLAALQKGWTIKDSELTRTFELATFPAALLFVATVGYLAEHVQHHPDILIQYRKVQLSLTTHDSGGITEQDFALAVRIDEIPL